MKQTIGFEKEKEAHLRKQDAEVNLTPENYIFHQFQYLKEQRII